MSPFMSLLVSSIPLAVIFLYGCLGEIITEKAGHLNLGIPGIMCVGCAGGCFGASTYLRMLSNPSEHSWIILVLFVFVFAALFAALSGGIYAFLTVTLRCNQNISGLALTTFGAGFAEFFINMAVKKDLLYYASKTIKSCLPFATEYTSIGKLFFGHGIFVYIAIILAIVTHYILKKTKIGLNLRAVGENPATADAVGINVTGYKYAAILIGSAIAGLGGMFYTLDYTIGTFDNSSMIQEFGWLSIALVIFTLWKPLLAMAGSFIFGLLYILPNRLVLNGTAQQEAFYMLPYIITIVVLLIISITGSKKNQPPASLGLNYFREER